MAQQEVSKGDTPEQLVARIGHLTRLLRESMRDLGLDQEITKVAQAIPDARDRLNYVAAMTERAAERALNAIDVAQPIQEKLAKNAEALSRRWNEWFESPVELENARALVLDTRTYLKDLPQQTRAINEQLIEIMMAQDFQDLTGQVIKRMLAVVQEMEKQLLQMLIDNSPVENRNDSPGNLLNGPQVKAESSDSVSNQAQVDDLLSSLGF